MPGEVEEWYISLLVIQDYINEVFDRMSEMAIENFGCSKGTVYGIIHTVRFPKILNER